MVKLCGYAEKCFVNGKKEWGFWGSILCKYASEERPYNKDNGLIEAHGICLKDNKKCEFYSNEVERRDLCEKYGHIYFTQVEKKLHRKKRG